MAAGAAPAPKHGFHGESWGLYGAGVCCIIVRIAGRIRRAGWKGLDLDDGFIAFGLIWYTVLCVSLNEIACGIGTNFMTAEQEASLTPRLRADRVRDSKWAYVSEHAMLLTIWSMKAAMLVLYARITDGLRQRRLLYALIGWVCSGFLADEMALFLVCRPLSQYWAVPPKNPQCSTFHAYQIINAIFNVSTDILILMFGVPPVLQARMTVVQKVILALIFGMGVLAIAAAITRAIYCLVPSLVSYSYIYWYFREASVAVYVTTLPGIWVALREMFPVLQQLTTRHRRCRRRRRGRRRRRHSSGKMEIGLRSHTDNVAVHHPRRQPTKYLQRDPYDATPPGLGLGLGLGLDMGFDLDTRSTNKSATDDVDTGGPVSTGTDTDTETDIDDKDKDTVACECKPGPEPEPESTSRNQSRPRGLFGVGHSAEEKQ